MLSTWFLSPEVMLCNVYKILNADVVVLTVLDDDGNVATNI